MNNDIEIHLVRYGTDEENPIRTAEASYRDAARMGTRQWTEKTLEVFVDAIDTRQHELILRDETGLQISQSFQIVDEERDWVERELHGHIDRLIRAYRPRDCSHIGGDDE